MLISVGPTSDTLIYSCQSRASCWGQHITEFKETYSWIFQDQSELRTGLVSEEEGFALFYCFIQVLCFIDYFININYASGVIPLLFFYTISQLVRVHSSIFPEWSGLVFHGEIHTHHKKWFNQYLIQHLFGGNGFQDALARKYGNWEVSISLLSCSDTAWWGWNLNGTINTICLLVLIKCLIS